MIGPEKLDYEKMDKTAFSVAKLGQDDRDEFWRSRRPRERLEYLEFLRQTVHGPAATGSFQKVFEVVERSGR